MTTSKDSDKTASKDSNTKTTSKDSNTKTTSKDSISKTTSKDSTVPSAESYTEPERVEDKISRAEFICAAVAFALGSGNTWLLPEAIADAGTAFIIQFTVCYVLAAIPLYYMEVALGQFTSASPWCIYQMLSSAMSGVPAAMGFNVLLRSVVLAVWVTEFSAMFVVSLEGAWGELSYARCWHGETCYDQRLAQRCMLASPNDTHCKLFQTAMVNTRADFQKATPLVYFFEEFFEEREAGEAPTDKFPSIMLIATLMLTWILAGCSATAGIRFIGKLAYIVIAIAVLSCVMLLILAFTIGDVFFSLRHFYRPHPQVLYSIEKWIFAAGQALITLNVSTGGMIKIASARGFHQSIVPDVIIVAVAAVVVNAVILISMITLMERYAADLYPFDNPELRFRFVFVRKFMSMMLLVETMVGSRRGWILAAFYFLQLAAVPFQVLITDLWVVMSMLHEKYVSSFKRPLRKTQVAWSLIVMSILGFIASFFFILPGGFTQVLLVAKVCKDATLILGFLQLVTVAYIYGFKRFSVNIRTMVGGRGPVNFFWWFNWIVTSPFVHVACFVASFTTRMNTGGFIWRMIFGIATFIWIPINFMFKNEERRKIHEPIQMMFRPRKDWGPANRTDREEAKQMERALRVL